MATYLNPGPVFGPVRSRRLGVSLGVNLAPADGKRCSFDCVYCENGTNDERPTSSPWPTATQVAEALGARLRDMSAAGEPPDVITLAGNGEPTANPEFPEVVDAVLSLRDELCPKARVAVLSNATMAHVPAVRDALLRVDDNILKLDTVDGDFIRRVDRPVGGYDVGRVVDALAAFGGRVMVQSMFLGGELDGRSVDNTGEAYVGPWLEALARIRPEEVMVYTIARDTPFQGLRKASPEALDSIAARVRALGLECSVSY